MKNQKQLEEFLTKTLGLANNQFSIAKVKRSQYDIITVFIAKDSTIYEVPLGKSYWNAINYNDLPKIFNIYVPWLMKITQQDENIKEPPQESFEGIT